MSTTLQITRNDNQERTTQTSSEKSPPYSQFMLAGPGVILFLFKSMKKPQIRTLENREEDIVL
jgi:hypothetical protein